MKHDLILRVVAKLLIPFILLFALYVQFHGDFGPGGGFQAGVILAAAVIFYALIYGLADARKAVPEPLVESMMAVGVLIYAQWPMSSLYALGTLAGISLAFTGWSYVMIALAARRLAS